MAWTIFDEAVDDVMFFTDEYYWDEIQDNDQDSSDKSSQLPAPDQQKRIDFLNLVESSLQGRCQRLLSFSKQICRFKFSIMFDHLNLLSPRLDRLVALALEGNVKELDIDLKYSSGESPRYNVPQSVFLHKTLTTLNLSGCKFELEGDHNQLDLVILPHTRKMIFTRVVFRGLRAVHMFENLAASFPSIEYLEMCECHGLNKIQSASSVPQLKHVTLNRLYGVKMVDILAPELLTFAFNPSSLYHIDNLCEVNLPTSLLVKKLMLSQVRIGASMQKLLSELSGLLEVLKLFFCAFLEDADSYISVGHLKEMLLFDCRNLVINEFDNPLPASSSIPLEKVHIVFPIRTNDQWSKWKDLLMKSNIAGDLKVVIYNRLHIVVHENLSEVSASTLCDLQNLNFRIWISSIPWPKLLNFLSLRTCIQSLSVVCSSPELIDMLLVFCGSETITVTDQDQIEPPAALTSFIKEYATGEYNSATFRLKCKPWNLIVDRDLLDSMFMNFDILQSDLQPLGS